MLHLSQENFSLDKAVLLAARRPSKLLESFTLYKQAFALDVDSPLCKIPSHPDDVNQLQKNNDWNLSPYLYPLQSNNVFSFYKILWKNIANISDQITM